MTPLSARPAKRVIAGARKAPLASRLGIAVVVGILLQMGAMCPRCHSGTRNTSQRWAKCKRCGMRVPCGVTPTKEGP